MIEQTEYAKRRQALMQKIGKKGVAVVIANPEMTRSNDTHYPYRQNSDFYYLTGFEEPEAILVLAPHRKAGEYILFNRVRNRDQEIWEGVRAGQEGACTHFLADEAYPFESFESLLPELLEDRDTLFYPIGRDDRLDQLMMDGLNNVRQKIRGGVQIPVQMVDIAHPLHEMRLIKTKAELKQIKKAVAITSAAHIKAMQICKPGMNECELEAALLYEFNVRGAKHPAYGSIVGSGPNTCTLHYISNNRQIENGDLVLIDAGAEYHNYAADITRTFPANGKFTGPQQAIYEIVLASQLAAIETIQPGASWTSAQTVILKVITQGLVDLDILRGNVDDLIATQAYLPFYMHRSGHWLGLDVHDVGSYRIEKEWRPLAPGMVLTVEPGIYISADIKGVDPKWHHIGIRIEDDIVVTENGHDVLSHDIPKTVSDIEAIMQK